MKPGDPILLQSGQKSDPASCRIVLCVGHLMLRQAYSLINPSLERMAKLFGIGVLRQDPPL
jgi:hypothetical protein